MNNKQMTLSSDTKRLIQLISAQRLSMTEEERKFILNKTNKLLAVLKNTVKSKK